MLGLLDGFCVTGSAGRLSNVVSLGFELGLTLGIELGPSLGKEL